MPGVDSVQRIADPRVALLRRMLQKKDFNGSVHSGTRGSEISIDSIRKWLGSNVPPTPPVFHWQDGFPYVFPSFPLKNPAPHRQYASYNLNSLPILVLCFLCDLCGLCERRSWSADPFGLSQRTQRSQRRQLITGFLVSDFHSAICCAASTGCRDGWSIRSLGPKPAAIRSMFSATQAARRRDVP